MNRIRAACLHVGTWLALASSHALAQGYVQLVGLEGRVQPGSAIPAIFGGSEHKLDLNVFGISTQVGSSLRADLFQVAGSLSMPIAKDLHLDEAFSLSPAEPWAEQITLRFPEVKRRAEILVRLTALEESVLANGTRQTIPVVLGDLRFEVFPASVTKELADLLQPGADASPQIVVFGPGQKLRHFLSGLHLPFEDAGADRPDRSDPDRLYFGELATDEQFQQAQDRSASQDRSGIARLALFSPDESLPAGVYSEISPSGTFIHVTAPLLDDLSDDPRAQLGLIKIIHLLSAQYHPPPVE